MSLCRFILLSLLPLTFFGNPSDSQGGDEPVFYFTDESANGNTASAEDDSSEEEECTESSPIADEPILPPSQPSLREPLPRWYFEVKPGYYWFADSSMTDFFGRGAFTIRAETGCRVWGPLTVWIDGSYLHKDGNAIGGPELTHLMLATITLGLKLVTYFNDYIAVYAGAAPRLFLVKLRNESPYIRGEDNQIGIGWGFNGGFWILPFARCQNFSRNLFLDFFADYSMKKMKIDADEVSSVDYDIDVSGLTAGIGLGIRF